MRWQEIFESFEMVVYHGGPQPLIGNRIRCPLFVTPDIELARAYADSRSASDSKGVVTRFILRPKRLGSETNIEHAAEIVGVENEDYEDWELVSPSVCSHAYAVIRELEALGCDAVSFSDTMPNAASYHTEHEAIVVLDPYILSEPQIIS